MQILLKQVAGKPYALERRMASLSKCLPITVQDLIYPSWLCYWNRSRPNNCLITAVIVIFKSTALRFATMSSRSTEKTCPGREPGGRRERVAGGWRGPAGLQAAARAPPAPLGEDGVPRGGAARRPRLRPPGGV